jgi:glycerol-3-phosphate acyltransferase PlsY
VADVLNAAVVLAAYVLGSIPFSFLVVRLLVGKDVRTVGSGNVGATNALRAGGKKVGALALVLDFGKGFVAAWIARRLNMPEPVVAAVAAAVVLGHCYPVFLGFHGGKGVATAAGAMGSLAPLPFLLVLAVFGFVVWAWRFVSLGSIVATAAFPPLVWLCRRVGWTQATSRWQLLAATAIALLIILKHSGNLRRLLAGTERHLGEAPPKRDPDSPESAA